MSFIVRKRCEGCEGHLSKTGTAFVCVHERAFCEGCAVKTNRGRPDRGGEPAVRPRGEAP